MSRKNADKYYSILEASLKAMARHGYYRTRVSEIAREAGVADGTVYLYFKNKEDILISLFREMMNSFVNELVTNLSYYTSFYEKLHFIVHHHLETLSKNRDRAMVTQIELRQCDAELGKKIFAPLSRYFQVIEEVMEYGRETGEVRRDLDLRLARKIVFGSVDEVVTRWVMSQKDERQLTNLTEPLFFTLWNGLKSSPISSQEE